MQLWSAAALAKTTESQGVRASVSKDNLQSRISLPQKQLLEPST